MRETPAKTEAVTRQASHWIVLLLPVLVFGFGFSHLTRSKWNADFLGIPFVILLVLALALNLVFAIRAGVLLADRFEPERNRYVAGVIIGASGHFMSVLLGFLLWLSLLRDPIES